jgi:GT2 family glycosyltransferase
VNRSIRIVFCVPGREFSGRFLDCWTALLAGCTKLGIEYAVSREYDPVVYFARNKVAGGDVRRGKNQVPWGGAVLYDFMMWIDSDVIFTIQDVVELLKCNADIVCGLYLMQNRTQFAAVEHMDEKVFQRTGRFDFLTPETVAQKDGLFEVGYAGFGFTMVKRGVFESLEYPWFRPIFLQIGGCFDFTGEDVGFCMQARAAGLKILVNPKVIVGHEKALVLYPNDRDPRLALLALTPSTKAVA